MRATAIVPTAKSSDKPLLPLRAGSLIAPDRLLQQVEPRPHDHLGMPVALPLVIKPLWIVGSHPGRCGAALRLRLRGEQRRFRQRDGRRRRRRGRPCGCGCLGGRRCAGHRYGLRRCARQRRRLQPRRPAGRGVRSHAGARGAVTAADHGCANHKRRYARNTNHVLRWQEPRPASRGRACPPFPQSLGRINK